mmetsp:Transcript_15066/g.47352  ORF Transcript_15066/g.47352 Transcript_15066/m.47352 type:complete len:268 (+) Transcript_15066:312-1115(+)
MSSVRERRRRVVAEKVEAAEGLTRMETMAGVFFGWSARSICSSLALAPSENWTLSLSQTATTRLLGCVRMRFAVPVATASSCKSEVAKYPAAEASASSPYRDAKRLATNRFAKRSKPGVFSAKLANLRGSSTYRCRSMSSRAATPARWTFRSASPDTPRPTRSAHGTSNSGSSNAASATAGHSPAYSREMSGASAGAASRPRTTRRRARPADAATSDATSAAIAASSASPRPYPIRTTSALAILFTSWVTPRPSNGCIIVGSPCSMR